MFSSTDSPTARFLTRGQAVGHYVTSAAPAVGSGSFTGAAVVGSDAAGSYVSSRAAVATGALGSYISA
jgi:hypothetical protein